MSVNVSTNYRNKNRPVIAGFNFILLICRCIAWKSGYIYIYRLTYIGIYHETRSVCFQKRKEDGTCGQ